MIQDFASRLTEGVLFAEVSPGPGLLAATVPVVVVVTAVLVILLCICRPGEETCLKRGTMPNPYL